MRHPIIQLLLRVVCGFVLGFGMWVGLALPYHRVVAASAERAIHLFETPDRTDLRVSGREVIVYRSDVPPGSSRPGIPLYDLTFNVILLTVLFAADRHPLSNRNVGLFLLALLLLAPTHVAALVAWTEDLYASRFGPISERYSSVERSFWANAIYFYRLLGQFAIPLILRWSFVPQGPATSPVSRDGSHRPRRQAGAKRPTQSSRSTAPDGGGV